MPSSSNSKLVPAPKQRNTEDKKATIRAGQTAKRTWCGKANMAHQKPEVSPTGRQRC